MTDNDLVDLGIGEPDPRLLPAAEVREAARHAFLTTEGADYLGYGPEGGSPYLREQLALFLTEQSRRTVRPEELLITAGASHAIDLIITRLCQPGDTVFVEDPTYFHALALLNDRPVRLVPIPVDAGGLDVDTLERELQRYPPRLIYTIPVFHNPTGVVLWPDRRRRLQSLSETFGFSIVADEVYQLLGDQQAIPPPMASEGHPATLSVGSFSKILGPGLRLGWIQTSSGQVRTLERTGALLSGGGTSPVASSIVASAIALGLQDAYLDRLRHVYSIRRESMIAALHHSLPSEAVFVPPSGGFYVWVRLPDQVNTTHLLEEATRRGVVYRPGPTFSYGGRFANCLRLCYAHHDEHKLSVAVERLGDLLRSCQ